MMKTLKLQLKQAGISLLEVLLSLAIIAIILVMAMQYFTTATNNQKLNMVRTFIGADVAAFQSYSLNNSGYGTANALTWDALVGNGYLSTDTKNITCTTAGTGTAKPSGCKQITPWNGDVTLTNTTTSATLAIPLPNATFCGNLQQSYGGGVTVDCTDPSTAKITVNS